MTTVNMNFANGSCWFLVLKQFRLFAQWTRRRTRHTLFPLNSYSTEFLAQVIYFGELKHEQFIWLLSHLIKDNEQLQTMIIKEYYLQRLQHRELNRYFRIHHFIQLFATQIHMQIRLANFFWWFVEIYTWKRSVFMGQKPAMLFTLRCSVLPRWMDVIYTSINFRFINARIPITNNLSSK